jgi:hypothetical protein
MPSGPAGGREVNRKQRLEKLASLSQVRTERADGQAELRFDADHVYLQPGRTQFESEEDLAAHISELLPRSDHRPGIRGRVKRIGKYERINQEGDPIFSFGDPVLDSITDEQGVVEIGGRRYDLYAAEVARSDRGGGLTSIDFSEVEHMREAHFAASLIGDEYSIIECRKDALVVASRNPHEQWFYSGSTKMRFRAFRRSYVFYIKIGADIETWGHDFRTASISSRYGRFLDETHGHCFTIHTDSDSDSNDDYVDEYEWFVGGGVGSGYDGVRSWCVANWHDQIYSGAVAYGCIVLDF